MTLVSDILFVREYLVLMICKSSCKISKVVLTCFLCMVLSLLNAEYLSMPCIKISIFVSGFF